MSCYAILYCTVYTSHTATKGSEPEILSVPECQDSTLFSPVDQARTVVDRGKG